MFTTFHDANYHPLCWLSLGIDFVFWKMNPVGYHLTNIVLHVSNAVVFYFLIILLLRRVTAVPLDTGRLTLQISALIGTLFFAVHPLRVETVAWISTRGDLLCGFFYLLTIIAYMKIDDKNEPDDKRKWFFLSIFFFALSLLSRAWGITLPLVLLILDIYPLRRLVWEGRLTSSHKILVLEKIPFALLALSSGLLAFWAKKKPMLALAQVDVTDRIVQATYGLCCYFWKTVVPIRLSPLYLLENHFNPVEPKYVLCMLSVLGITETYYNRWILHEKRKDWGSAIADYTNVIRLNPKHAQAYNNHGTLLKRQGNLAGAIADFETAIRLNPFSPEAYANRGVIRLSQNDLGGAHHDFTKALELAAPNWPYKAQAEQILFNIRAALEE
jgi:tetratricopeptide (TPR) repeat protein